MSGNIKFRWFLLAPTVVVIVGCGTTAPLMGAFCLKWVDERMEKTGLFYIRFMDDWLVLSPSRWQLRKAIRITNQTLNKEADMTGANLTGANLKEADLTGVNLTGANLTNANLPKVDKETGGKDPG